MSFTEETKDGFDRERPLSLLIICKGQAMIENHFISHVSGRLKEFEEVIMSFTNVEINWREMEYM
jgi:hypothetical protein